ncbi:uncharacterized protein PG986_002964 [Apiospora aurea]|uniref:Uncharacterized protein n=1 Tax=Apiospora aurea TaxID=335848 RepID=A0ABR1QQA9_9PEZI
MLQAVGGDGSMGMGDSNSGLDTLTQMLAGTPQQQTQPDLTALFQGAAAGQQPDLVLAILQQQQQQQYSDATSSLLGNLAGGGAQGAQTDPSQQIMDAIQQQSAASMQTLFSAMQNNPSSAQGQQDFATQMLSALSQQQQQQQPQAQADLMAVIQQQQAASTQALLSAMQGASTNGQSYGSQALASILQQQEQQQQTQQANPAPSAAQQSSTLSPQDHVAYEEQLLNAALQQQQQQYGTFASIPATQPGEAFTHNTSQPATYTPQAEPSGASQDPCSPSFSYNGPSGPSQYQQPFVHQQTGVSNPNQHTGPMNNNYSTAPQPQIQAQQNPQQGPTGPNTSIPATSNTAVTPPPLQQQTPVSGQPTFQGWPDNGQVELTLNHCTPQNSALPQQTQQGSGFHQYNTAPSPATTMPAPHHPPDPFSANAAPYGQVTSQYQHQHQQQPHPASHNQQTTPALASSEALSDINATPSIAGQQHAQHSAPQAAGHPSGSTTNNSNPEATVNHQPSYNVEFYGKLTPEINISPNISLDLNVSQATPSTSLDISTFPPSPPRSVVRPKAAPGSEQKRTLDPAPPPSLRPPVRPAAPGTTLQQTSPNILTGDLDADQGISFEIRLLYNPTQIEREINALRSTVSTQTFVVVQPYSSHASFPSSISTHATSHNPQVTEETTTANEEAEASPEGGVEAVVTPTVTDNTNINNTQTQVNAITLASTTPDADGDMLSLHKLVAVPTTNFDHGLVFSFYAPLLPPPPPPDLDLDYLSPVEQFVKTILDSIIWVDRSTVCKMVSEKLLGTWVLHTPLNPSSPLSVPSVPGEEEDGVESTAVEVVLRGLSLESVAIKSEAVNVSEEAPMQHYETRTLRFLEDRKYIYNRDIVSDAADVVRRANNDDSSTKKVEEKEACLEDEEAYYDPNHTRGCFEIYQNPDGTMHLVLTENDTGSVEVQTIKFTDKGMLVRGRDYVKTS